MWTTVEDSQRYRELEEGLRSMLDRKLLLKGHDLVAPHDVALYLEWMELLRETAPCMRPFLDKSSPFQFASMTYREMASDFRWLADEVGAARRWDV